MLCKSHHLQCISSAKDSEKLEKSMCVRDKAEDHCWMPVVFGPSDDTASFISMILLVTLLNGPRKKSKNMSKTTTNSTAAGNQCQARMGTKFQHITHYTITYENFLHFSSRIYVYYSSSITMSICSLIQSAGIIRNDPGIISIYSERKRERERGKADNERNQHRGLCTQGFL